MFDECSSDSMAHFQRIFRRFPIPFRTNTGQTWLITKSRMSILLGFAFFISNIEIHKKEMVLTDRTENIFGHIT